MSLVTGYDSSDSEEEADVITHQAVPPLPDQSGSATGLSSLLPPPKHANRAPPTAASSNSNKRRADKLQIRIGALKDVEGDDDGGGDGDSASAVKKPRIGGGGHGLFSMLPAPSNKNPQPPKKGNAADHDGTPVNNLGISDASAGAITLQEATSSDASGLRKTKGNNDFRAMLGLKPSTLATPVRANKETNVKATEALPKSNVALSSERELVSGASSKPASHDFFSLGSDSTSTSNVAPRSDGPHVRSSISVSLAPTVSEDDQAHIPSSPLDERDPYEGWQQGPDGAWFPVTPAAHEQYQRFLASSASDQEHGLRMAEADAGSARIDQSRMHDTDVNAGLADWLARPTKDAATTTKADSLDQRYALAAASVAGPGQARVEVPMDASNEAAKHGDKTTNMRARRKGQLTSLIAQAEENREKLEDRWARGRAARNEAQKRYGF